MKEKLVLRYKMFTKSEDGLLKPYRYSGLSFDSVDDAMKELTVNDCGVLIIPITELHYEWGDENE
jgi:hypothetical protein